MGAVLDVRRHQGEQGARRPRLAAGIAVRRAALLGNGACLEQITWLLRNQPDRAQQGGARQCRRVVSVDQHAAGHRRTDADQGVEQRRLAGSVAAHQRNDLAG
jgi:hypothetical protein